MKVAMVAAAVGLAALPARAQDRFEIQVYDTEVAEPGHPGLELHTNFALKGSRATSPDGELATEHVLHTTLEPHVGVFGWGELGGYLQGALRPDGTADFAGVKLRFKARWPRKLRGERLGLAINFELSRVPARYESNVWGSEVRPAIDLREGILYLSLNPIVSTDLQGPLAGRPQLEPAFKLALFALPQLSAGLETYAGLGPIDGLLPLSRQNHHLFGAVDYNGDWFDFNLGLGRGLGAAEPWVAKAILGVHPPGTPASHGPPTRDDGR